MALTGNMRISASLTNTLAGVDLTTPTDALSTSTSKTIASGVLYHDTATIASSGTLTLTFNDDSLSDVFGNTIAMTTVTGIYIKAADANTVDLTITTTTNSMLPTMPALSAGEGISLLCDIDTSTDSKLNIVNGAAESNVDIIITGTE